MIHCRNIGIAWLCELWRNLGRSWNNDQGSELCIFRVCLKT